MIVGSEEPELWSRSELDSNPSSIAHISVRHWPSYITATCFLTQNMSSNTSNTTNFTWVPGIESGTERKISSNAARFHHITPRSYRFSCEWKESCLRTWTRTSGDCPVNAKVSGMGFISSVSPPPHPNPIVPLLSQGPSGPGLGKSWNMCSSLPCQGHPGGRSLGQGLFTFSSISMHPIQSLNGLACHSRLDITWSTTL